MVERHGLATGDPEVAATTVRLLLAHLTWNSKRLLGAMVLDRLDVELATTRLDVHNDVHGLGMSTGMSTDLRALKKVPLQIPCPGMVEGGFHPQAVIWVIRLTSPHLP